MLHTIFSWSTSVNFSKHLTAITHRTLWFEIFPSMQHTQTCARENLRALNYPLLHYRAVNRDLSHHTQRCTSNAADVNNTDGVYTGAQCTSPRMIWNRRGELLLRRCKWGCAVHAAREISPQSARDPLRWMFGRARGLRPGNNKLRSAAVAPAEDCAQVINNKHTNARFSLRGG